MSNNMDDLKTYLSHLEKSAFNGTVMLTFSKGRPTNLSKKEDLIIGELGAAMRRSVFVVKKPEVKPVEAIEMTAEAGKEGTDEAGRA